MKNLFNKLKNKNTLFGLSLGLLLGGIIFGSIGVVAVTLTADQVSFTPNDSSFSVNNTKAAIDSLYDMALNNSQSVVYLGTGTSFDLTSYSGYQNFTADNFIVGIQKATASGSVSVGVGLSGGGSASASVSAPSITVSKSYDASTGLLTVSPASAALSYSKSWQMTLNSTGSQTYTYFAYLVY